MLFVRRNNMKTSRVSRIVKLLIALQTEQNCNVDDLAKLLGTSRRTVFRDLKELQAISVPYHYDKNTGGYSIDPDFFLPPIDLQQNEALSLLLLAHKAGHQMQLPFYKSALLAAMKIENNLPPNIRKYCSGILQNITTRPSPQAPTDFLDKNFGLLQEAIAKKRKVTLTYDSIFDGKLITIELSPYHLMYNHRAWYVLGYSDMHKSIRTFKLNRIKEIKMAKRCYIEDEFDLCEYLGRAWSIIPEGRIYNIKHSHPISP